MQSKSIISVEPGARPSAAPFSPANPEPEQDQDSPEDLGPAVEQRPLGFGMAEHGQRLDLALAAAVPEFSRSYLQQLIAAGAVLLRGQVQYKAALRIKAGDRGSITLAPTPQSQAFVPEPLDLCVLYEDEHLRVINKPAGLVVHPAPGHWRGTLLNGLLARDAQASLLPRAGIVHRLDKDTSGLMVVARSRQAMDALVRQIAAREVKRQYLALAHRPWTGEPARWVRQPIGRDPRQRLRMAVVDLAHQAGKTAATWIECLASVSAGCLLRCTLETGRTHQIRVHAASLGHPLLADVLYGGSLEQAPGDSLQRQALHAHRLSLVHPVSGEALSFQAPPPEDMLQALVDWGLSYNQDM